MIECNQEELKKIRNIVKTLPMDGKNTAKWWEVCCGLVLIAEENSKDSFSGKDIENPSLARELVPILKYLKEYEHMENNVYEAASRIAKIIYDHPRLHCELLSLQIEMLRCKEARMEHDIDLTDELCNERNLYLRNIEAADKGEYHQIVFESNLKHDPVEWSAEYEACIDEVEKKVNEELELPRGMGFCYAYWSVKKRILETEYNIQWHTPSELNPGVMFD